MQMQFFDFAHNEVYLKRKEKIIILPGSEMVNDIAPFQGLKPYYKPLRHLIDIEKGDSLLIYSDGLSEARNINKDEFGDNQLCEEID